MLTKSAVPIQAALFGYPDPIPCWAAQIRKQRIGEATFAPPFLCKIQQVSSAPRRPQHDLPGEHPHDDCKGILDSGSYIHYPLQTRRNADI